MAASSAKPGQPFRFAARHARLDWRLLAELDCDRIWRETDIDALERALDTVCYGDLSVEDPRHITGERLPRGWPAARPCSDLPRLRTPKVNRGRRTDPAPPRPGPSMVKLFRLAQMQVEYLLHVQVRVQTAVAARPLVFGH